MFEEGLGKELVLDGGAVHLLHEGEDLNDLGVPLLLEKPLREHENEPHVLAIVEVDLPLSFLFCVGGELQVGVDLLQGLKVQLLEIDIEEVGDELLASVVEVPLLADGVDVEGVHHHVPLLKDLHQFKLGVLLVPQGVVAVLQDIEDVFDLVLDLLVELDGLVGVDGVDGVSDQLIDVLCLVDVQLLQDLLVIQDALYHVELLPLDQDLAVGQQEFLLTDVVVDGLQDVEQHCEHVPAEVQGDLLVLDPD